MKRSLTKLIFITFLPVFIFVGNEEIFSQSNWNNIFFNNVNTVTKILQIDSTNFIGLCNNSQFYFRSSDAGITWLSSKAYSFDSVYNLYGGQFISSTTGWVIGSSTQFYTGNGVILKTTNGGKSWFRQITGFDNYICLSISFINENTGWIGSAGNNVGYLLKTVDGGLNWSKQDFPGILQIRGVKFFDENNGWILGIYGLLAKTSNGGITWEEKPISGYTQHVDLYALNMNECWVLVSNVINARVYSRFFKTSDGGDNWDLTFNYTDSLTTNGKSFSKLYFINSDTGFANGAFKFFFKTTNSGVNWYKVDVLSHSGNYPHISSISAIDNDNILAAGGFSGLGSYPPYNFFLKSSNSGQNWQTQNYNQYTNFRQVHFTDIKNGIALTDSGRIYKTTNNGTDWTKTLDSNSLWIWNVGFANNANGNAFGDYGVIFKTSNYGSTWENTLSPTNYNLRNSNFINETTGIAYGVGGTIIRTTDSGNSWNLVNSTLSDSFHCVESSFIEENNGWLLAIADRRLMFPPYTTYWRTKIIKTSDAGETWNVVYDTVNTPIYRKLKFFDSNNGWLLSSNVLKKTTNGGVNWIVHSLNTNLDVHVLEMMDEKTGWIGGRAYVNGNYRGVLLKTTNSGMNWDLQYLHFNPTSITSLHFLDYKNGWFSGDRNSIYYTNNGGGDPINISPINTSLPTSFSLSQNYPNPFNPITKIKFSIPSAQFTKLKIYNSLGQEVTTLVNQQLQPGSYEYTFDASGLSSGVYFYRLEAGDPSASSGQGFVETKRLVLVK